MISAENRKFLYFRRDVIDEFNKLNIYINNISIYVSTLIDNEN